MAQDTDHLRTIAKLYREHWGKDVVNAGYIDFAADEIEKLRAGLKNIATQKTTEELKAKDEQEYDDADFEGAYDAIIHIARRALEPVTG